MRAIFPAHVQEISRTLKSEEFHDQRCRVFTDVTGEHLLGLHRTLSTYVDISLFSSDGVRHLTKRAERLRARRALVVPVSNEAYLTHIALVLASDTHNDVRHFERRRALSYHREPRAGLPLFPTRPTSWTTGRFERGSRRHEDRQFTIVTVPACRLGAVAARRPFPCTEASVAATTRRKRAVSSFPRAPLYTF